MKRVLLIILLFALAGGNTTINAEGLDACKEIQLTAVQNNAEREIKGKPTKTTSGNVPVSRSIIHQPVYAYIYSSIVSVSFEATASTATVTITRESTGETVYSEVHSSPSVLNINLNGESSGSYLIEIEADGTYLQGTFSL